MVVWNPKLPAHLTRVDDFSSYVREFLIEELPIQEMEWIDAKEKYGEFRKNWYSKKSFYELCFDSLWFLKKLVLSMWSSKLVISQTASLLKLILNDASSFVVNVLG